MQTYTNNDNTTQCEATKELRNQGYTDGLIRSIQRNQDSFPLRIWVVDNSLSMTVRDGHILQQLPQSRRINVRDGSRWDEIVSTVNQHAKTAAVLEAPTTFRLLNPYKGIEEFGVASENKDNLETTLATLHKVAPSGRTPLTARVTEIASDIAAMADDLRAKGQKVVVVLATDGLPTDPKGRSTSAEQLAFKAALARFEGLPVWLVIRLCTDNDDVVNFYNNLDGHLELSLDVLDDYFAEALEVYEHNKWLTYALPIHRMREMGFYHKLFDLIDERPLTRDELPEFFRLLFGADVLDGLPDPQLDWAKFLERIATVVRSQPDPYNPVKKRTTPWVRIEKLDQIYGERRKLPKAIKNFFA